MMQYARGQPLAGAEGRRRGLIEQAAGGNLFRDEPGELELDLQAKLLKAIDNQRVRRVGGERELDVDVRVIAAMNQDLEARIARDLRNLVKRCVLLADGPVFPERCIHAARVGW